MAPRARFLRVPQVVELTGIEARTIRHLLDKGRLPFKIVPGDAKRTRRIPREAAEALARQMREGA